MTPTVRFAPSPTGYLHVGNIRCALLNWLFARKYKGTFILRLDDTDQERSREEYAEAIKHDLKWLLLEYNKVFQQSDRMERYKEVIQHLIDIGRLYPCYETPEELEIKRKSQLARRKPPIYDRAALELSAQEKGKFEAEGRQPHWRFRLNPTSVEWKDLIRGPIVFEGALLSDPVLVRADKTPVYMLSSVVDDLDYSITHIIRGEDHVANTALQLQLIEALGSEPRQICFAHYPWLLDAQGGPLSKRLGSLSVRGLRDKGIEPMTINSFLAKLGTSDAILPASSMEELIEQFNLEKISRSAPRFSEDELQKLNARCLHEMSYEKAAERFTEQRMDIPASFWAAVRGNLEKFEDIFQWWTICNDPLEPVIEDEDKAYMELAAKHLPLEPWDSETWRAWTATLKEVTERSGKSLYKPLRFALTGQSHGPEMQLLLPFIGYQRAYKRLKGQRA